jgi:hypothetical protein
MEEVVKVVGESKCVHAWAKEAPAINRNCSVAAADAEIIESKNELLLLA